MNLVTNVKLCKGCAVAKPIHQFYPHPSNRDGRDSTCRQCRKRRIVERQRERYHEDPVYRRECLEKKHGWYATRRVSGPLPGGRRRTEAARTDVARTAAARTTRAA